IQTIDRIISKKLDKKLKNIQLPYLLQSSISGTSLAKKSPHIQDSNYQEL
ncbi:15632_t:CDS:1, partial [Dentiscutata heterogama]